MIVQAMPRKHACHHAHSEFRTCAERLAGADFCIWHTRAAFMRDALMHVVTLLPQGLGGPEHT